MIKVDQLKDAKNFNVKYFEKIGFTRQKCKKCGKFFWSSVQRDTCGDTTCNVYEFIGNPLIPGKWDWKALQRKYMNWFSNNKHEPIERYSTVARWKPDTLFTGASIYDFMPWVLNGTIEPPANPLVVAQPCIRFVDIDNVGLGSGRHCTEFTMFGHHAFNYPKKTIYWKEATLELCHQWFKQLKVNMKNLTYVENAWQGGGWAGPCFEVMLGGNEVATLVFMEYEGPFQGMFRPMKISVVDTGYGLERMVWASQGTPTIYDAVHKNVISFLKKQGNIANYDTNVFSEFCKLSAILNVEEINVEKQRKIILQQLSKKLGVSVDSLLEQIYPYHNIYKIADHTKALMFLLGDGVVPSNMQAGYLARLLVRRTTDAINNLNMDLNVGSVVEKQIAEVADIYPEFAKNKEDILKMVEIEQNKYKKTLGNAKGVVAKFEDLMKKSGKKKFDKKSFVVLYESYGLTPEVITKYLTLPAETVSSADIREDIKNTLTREEQEKHRVGDYGKVKTLAFAEGLPATELLYYKNEHCFEFKASVLKVFDNLVILDQTCFYPRGGGAEPDLGTINNKKVIDVEKAGNVIIHTVEGKLIKGQAVKCKVDKARRDQITRHHTATHLINGAAQQVLGNHVWQEGTKKDVDKAHLNVTHYAMPTEKELQKIQELANSMVKKNIRINKTSMTRTEAEQKFSFRIYQGGAVPGRVLRIINIPDWDVEACGGMHKDRTGEVGKIIISKVDRPHEGVVRFVFHAGPAADRWLKKQTTILKETTKVLGVPESQVPSATKKLFEEWKTLRKKLQLKGKKEARKLADGMTFNKGKKFQLLVKEIPNATSDQLQIVSQKLSQDNTVIIFFGVTDKIHVFGSAGKDTGINIGLIVSKICQDLGGKGGGSRTVARGIATKKQKIKEMITKIKKELS